MANINNQLISLEDITEELVIEYLCTHPEFFQHHEDILENLDIPHPCGKATSLIERQIKLLRNKETAIRQEMLNTMQIAKANEELFTATKKLTLALFAANNLNELVHSLIECLCEDLRAEYVKICLRNDKNHFPDGKDILFLNNKTNQTILAVLNSNKTICSQLSNSNLQYLFSDKGKNIASTALVPLKGFGLIAIGSSKFKHFNPNMDTLFLDYIGMLTTEALKQVWPYSKR